MIMGRQSKIAGSLNVFCWAESDLIVLSGIRRETDGNTMAVI